MNESEKPRPAPPVDAPPRDDVHVAGSPVRCPFCHEHVAVDALDWVACVGCLARHHHVCWHEGARCAACGGRELLVGRRRLPWAAFALASLILVAAVAAAVSAIVGVRERAERAEALLAAQAEREARARHLAGVASDAAELHARVTERVATAAERARRVEYEAAQQAERRELERSLGPQVHTSPRFTVLEDGHGHWIAVASDAPDAPCTSVVFGLGSYVLDLHEAGLRVRPTNKHVQVEVTIPAGGHALIVHDARGASPRTTTHVGTRGLRPDGLERLMRHSPGSVDVLDLLRRAGAAD